MLLGIWTNITHLEDCLSLPELEAILRASREREHRQNKFMAALKGIDLDKGSQEEAGEAFDRVQRRVNARLYGATEEQIEHLELGFDFEVEE